MRRLTPLLLAVLLGGCSLIVRNKLNDEEGPRDGGIDGSGKHDQQIRPDGQPPLLDTNPPLPIELQYEKERRNEEGFLIGEWFWVRATSPDPLAVMLHEVELQSLQFPDQRTVCPCEHEDGDRVALRCSIPPSAVEGPSELRVRVQAEPLQEVQTIPLPPILVERLLVAQIAGKSSLHLVPLSDPATGVSPTALLTLSYPLAARQQVISPSGRFLLVLVEVGSVFRLVLIDLVRRDHWLTDLTLPATDLEMLNVRALFQPRYAGRSDDRPLYQPEKTCWVFLDQKLYRIDVPAYSDADPSLVPVVVSTIYKQLDKLIWAEDGAGNGWLVAHENPLLGQKKLVVLAPNLINGPPVAERVLDNNNNAVSLIPVQGPTAPAQSVLVLSKPSGFALLTLYKLPYLDIQTSAQLPYARTPDALVAVPGTHLFGMFYHLAGGAILSTIGYGRLAQELLLEEVDLQASPQIFASTLPTRYGAFQLAAAAQVALGADTVFYKYLVFDSNNPDLRAEVAVTNIYAFQHHPLLPRLLAAKDNRLVSYSYELGGGFSELSASYDLKLEASADLLFVIQP